jgi:hypothetical protein
MKTPILVMAYAPAVRLRRPRDEAGKRDVDNRMLDRGAPLANRGIHFWPLRISHPVAGPLVDRGIVMGIWLTQERSNHWGALVKIWSNNDFDPCRR